MNTTTLIFSVEGNDHEIALIDDSASETLKQLRAWAPADIDIHCAKIAGCHVYWPCPILARLEHGTDIHTLPPGAVLYYPDRQYLEIIYDALQAETAAVTLVGMLKGDVGWLREFATRQRREAGAKTFTARLRMSDGGASQPEAITDGPPAWLRVQQARRAVWSAEPAEVKMLLARSGHNIPFGPMATADGYFRFVQECVWQVWNQPERYDSRQKQAIAVNALELGIARIGHYCHLGDSESFLKDAIVCVERPSAPLQDIFREIIFYCSRMSNWIDLHIPWFAANELAKRTLGRND